MIRAGWRHWRCSSGITRLLSKSEAHCSRFGVECGSSYVERLLRGETAADVKIAALKDALEVFYNVKSIIEL